MEKLMLNERYDFFLIWGHGLPYKEQIIDIIEKTDNLEIIKIISYKPKSIKKFITEVYNFDYAPVMHLKNKTRYLKKTSRQVLLIFVRNRANDEMWISDIKNGHFESAVIKKTKEKIRNMFNEYVEGKRTENHVIHGSDNPIQTKQMLQLLNYPEGIHIFEKKRIGDMPYHIGLWKNVVIKKVRMKDIYARINRKGGKEVVPLVETPHYRALQEGMEIYERYLNEYMGVTLCDYYSKNKFLKMKTELKYLQNEYKSSYIFVHKLSEEADTKYVILDGLHRASILQYRGEKDIIVAEVIFK